MSRKLYTLGYENASIDDFIVTLKTVGIEQLIDIRELPVSRRKGYSKNILRKILNANDIEYVHLKGLGDPKDGRDAARAGNYKEFKQIFTKHMKTPMAITDLAKAIELVAELPSCLLCYERNPKECHRTIVAKTIADKTGHSVNPIGVAKDIARKEPIRIIYPTPEYA